MNNTITTVRHSASACLFCLLLMSCSHNSKAPEPDTQAPPRVSIVQSMRTAVQPELSYPGEIRASRQTELSFRVSGPLTAILKQPGDHVKKGEVLMQIDQRDYLDNIKILEAELRGAQARSKKSTSDFERAKKLLHEDVIARSDYDMAQSSAASAQATVQNLKAQLSLARHQYEDTSLRAPYNGIVTAQLAENHEMIRAGQIVTRVHDISTLEIDCNVAENDINRFDLKKGLQGLITLPAAEDRSLSAELKEWSTAAENTTRTYRLTFSLSAPEDGSILPGMTGEITISNLKSTTPVVTIPIDALAAGEEGNSMVWLYDTRDGTLRSHIIETGAMTDDNTIVVTSGLKGDESIALTGSQLISEGMQVTVQASHDPQSPQSDASKAKGENQQ